MTTFHPIIGQSLNINQLCWAKAMGLFSFHQSNFILHQESSLEYFIICEIDENFDRDLAQKKNHQVEEEVSNNSPIYFAVSICHR